MGESSPLSSNILYNYYILMYAWTAPQLSLWTEFTWNRKKKKKEEEGIMVEGYMCISTLHKYIFFKIILCYD